MNHKPNTLNPKPSTPNPTPTTLNPKHSTLNTQHSTLNTQHSTLHQSDPEYKLIVFFTTARQTQFFAELFNGMGIAVL